MPQWLIYCSGHGGLKETICALTLDDFKKFLDFLDIKIITKLFAYSSCYAHGTNANLIFNDFKTGMYKTFSYPIAASGFNDLPVAGGTSEIVLAPLQINLRSIFDNPSDINIKEGYISVDLPSNLITWQLVKQLIKNTSDIHIDNNLITYLLPIKTDVSHSAIQLKLPRNTTF